MSKTALSFEVIPPRNDAEWEAVPGLLELLESYNPDYVAVTSARGTGWAQGTADFIEKISTTTSLRPLAHLTCTSGTVEELLSWVDAFVDSGVRGFLALRGDLPAGATSTPPGHLDHADALVHLLRTIEKQNVARLCAGRLAVGVAAYPQGHPESANFDEDIDVLAAKARNGADFAITQLFFETDAYARLLDQANLAGIDIPIIPGLMPITGQKRLDRMCKLSGLTPPGWIVDALTMAATPEDAYRIGLDISAQLARAIIDSGAPGLHIYTFNNPQTVTDFTALLPKGTS